MPDDLAPPFLPPVEVPNQLPTAPNIGRTHPAWLAWLAIALTPVVTVCTAVGAYTIAHGVVRSSHPRVTMTQTAHKQVVHLKPVPTPSYNLAGYQAALSGAQGQAFVAALNQFRSDARHYKFQALPTDSLNLSSTASTWLVQLRKTLPPPSYQASKLDYVLAATLGGRAAMTTQSAIASADLNALAQGASLATQAKQAFTKAIQDAPHGS